MSKVHIRQLFKDVFGIKQDEDFVTHLAATASAIQSYIDGGDGPNINDLHLDMQGSYSSEWNKRAFDLLLGEVRNRRDREGWLLPMRSDRYFEELIRDRFKRLRIVWHRGQCRPVAGGRETPAEAERRMVHDKVTQLKKARHNTRRNNVSREW